MNVKALLAVFTIVIAVGFVAANVTPQASALCNAGSVLTNSHGEVCTGVGQPHFSNVPPQFIH